MFEGLWAAIGDFFGAMVGRSTNKSNAQPKAEVFSREECPFRYCDTEAPHSACLKWCRHAAPMMLAVMLSMSFSACTPREILRNGGAFAGGSLRGFCRENPTHPLCTGAATPAPPAKPVPQPAPPCCKGLFINEPPGRVCRADPGQQDSNCWHDPDDGCWLCWHFVPPPTPQPAEPTAPSPQPTQPTAAPTAQPTIVPTPDPTPTPFCVTKSSNLPITLAYKGGCPRWLEPLHFEPEPRPQGVIPPGFTHLCALPGRTAWLLGRGSWLDPTSFPIVQHSSGAWLQQEINGNRHVCIDASGQTFWHCEEPYSFGTREDAWATGSYPLPLFCEDIPPPAPPAPPVVPTPVPGAWPPTLMKWKVQNVDNNPNKAEDGKFGCHNPMTGDQFTKHNRCEVGSTQAPFAANATTPPGPGGPCDTDHMSTFSTICSNRDWDDPRGPKWTVKNAEMLGSPEHKGQVNNHHMVIQFTPGVCFEVCTEPREDMQSRDGIRIPFSDGAKTCANHCY